MPLTDAIEAGINKVVVPKPEQHVAEQRVRSIYDGSDSYMQFFAFNELPGRMAYGR